MIEGLSPDDPGVRLLGDALRGEDPQRIALVHCGDLPGVRPGALRVVLDVREAASSVHTCVPHPTDWPETTRPTGFRSVDHAAVWPRAHLGKDFAAASLALGTLCLADGGTLWCSVRKAKGADSLADTMATICGDVEVVARKKGYRLLRATRSDGFDADAARSLLAVRYQITDPILGQLRLDSAPGVFSRRELDAGTRALIERVAQGVDAPAGPVLDAGAGIGPLALWAARRFPERPVLALESNLIAAELLEANASRAGLADRVTVWRDNAFVALVDPAAHPDPALRRGGLALVNPPTHAAREDLAGLYRGLANWLVPGGLALLVVNRPGASPQLLEDAGARVTAVPTDRYTILEARFGG